MTALLQLLSGLNDVGYRPAAAAALAGSLDATGDALEALIESDLADRPEAAASAALLLLHRHHRDLLREIHRLLGGSGVPQLAFVSRDAVQMAELRFPLETMLHCYRRVQRFVVRWLNSAGSAAAQAQVEDFVKEYIETVSTMATIEYVQRTRQLAEAEADTRSQLLTLLLGGYDPQDEQAARLLRGAGYGTPHMRSCVVLARPDRATSAGDPARLTGLLAAVREALDRLQTLTLYGLHENEVVAVVSAPEAPSVAQAPESSEARGAPQATSANRLADRVAWSLLQLGDDVRVGISADVPSTALVARALREGQLALDQAGAKARIVKYSEIPLRQLLLQVAGEQACSALPAWTEALLSSDARSKHKLSATLRQYADADMNVLQAAKALGVHPNTIYARMQRIRDITGQDPTRFHALTELLLAIDCAGV
jgi:hypothetical protein